MPPHKSPIKDYFMFILTLSISIGFIILMFPYHESISYQQFLKSNIANNTNNSSDTQLLIYSYINLKKEKGKLAHPHQFEGFCKSMYVNLYAPLKLNITYLGWDPLQSTSNIFFTNLLAKIEYTMNEMNLLSHIYSPSQLNETIILFVDALDVVIQFSKPQIIDTFLNSFPKSVFDNKVVFMAEKECMKQFTACDGSEFKKFKLPNDTFGTLYMNTGVFIGKHRNVLHLMQVLHNEILTMQKQQNMVNNDQGLIVKLWDNVSSILHKPRELIWIDYYSHIAASMLIRNENNRWVVNEKIYLKTYDENVDDDGYKYRYFNSEIGNFPTMVHFNGVRDPWSFEHFPKFIEKNKIQPISGDLHIPITSDGQYDLYRDMCTDYGDLYF